MATIVDRKNARGHIIGYQVKVRRKGQKAQSRTFTRLADAKRWARQIEGEMDQGVFIDRTESEATTLYEALERYEREVTPRKKGAVQERKRLSAWMRDPLANRSLASIRGSGLASWRDKRLGKPEAKTTKYQ